VGAQETDVLRVLAAAVGGLAIGLERQWSGHASGPHAHFGGIRTFTLLGGLAGLAGLLWAQQREPLALVLLAGAATLVLAAYVARARHDVDGTTEVAALVVLAAGTLAGTGELAVASAVIAVTALVLVERSRLHSLAHGLDDESMRAAARFAVMAVVVLPLLPPGPYGPGGIIEPRRLWMLVLLFSGLSFAGYIARRIVGTRHGYLAAGLLGGFVSSTSVTLTFARLSRTERASATPLALGVVAASSVMFVRSLVAAAVLSSALVPPLLPFLVPPAVVGALVVVAGLQRARAQAQVAPPRNPLQLGAALQMAAAFQLVLILVQLARRYGGDAGVLATAALVGTTDVDAVTVSMARSVDAGLSLTLAAEGIAVGSLSNTLLKLGLALGFGTRSFGRLAAAGLAALALTLVATLVAMWLY
jgi:uncharacterized membrane protein (DUF4010 family)